MAYGTSNGVSNLIKDYTALVTAGTITTQMVTDAITDADGEIDAEIAPIVGITNVPLVSPPQIVRTCSNYLAACQILRRVFTQKDVNISDWVEGDGEKTGICPKGQLLLDKIKSNPEILNTATTTIVADEPDSTTLDYDAIFSVGQTQDDGATDVSTGTMDDW